MSRRAPRPTDPKRMPFSHHLEELRWHLLRSILYLCLAAGFSWWQYDTVYGLIAGPINHAYHSAGIEPKLLFLDFLEPLFFRIQIVMAAAVVITLPLVIYEIWRFVKPGLHPEEQRFVGPLLPFSLLLCFAGFALIYFALPLAISFLLKFLPQTDEIDLRQNPQRYLFFLVRMMIGAGVVFQTPIVMLLLAQLELVTAAGLLRFWRHAVLVCFIVAAIITPTVDPLNMSIIAIPLVGLFFLSVLLVWRVDRKRARQQAREAAQAGAETTPEAPAEPPEPAPEPVATPATPSLLPPAREALAPEPAPDPGNPPPMIDRSVLGPLHGPGQPFDPPAEDPPAEP